VTKVTNRRFNDPTQKLLDQGPTDEVSPCHLATLSPCHLVILLCAGWLIVLATSPALSDPLPEPRGKRAEERPVTQEECDQLVGKSVEHIRQRFGPPRERARQILYHRYLEQWVYKDPYMIRVEIDCQGGKKPQVQNVQPLNPGNP
jgi:hypothetical protein